MILNRWNIYLKANNTAMFETKQASAIRGIIDYFSAPNLLDTFSLGGDFNYDNSQFQFLTNNSVLLTENSIYNIQSWDDSLNLNFLDYRTLLPNSGSLGTLNTYINDINLITPLNSNINNLIEFFPERVMHFENFELSNLEPYEGVFGALSTPDFILEDILLSTLFTILLTLFSVLYKKKLLAFARRMWQVLVNSFKVLTKEISLIPRPTTTPTFILLWLLFNQRPLNSFHIIKSHLRDTLSTSIKILLSYVREGWFVWQTISVVVLTTLHFILPTLSLLYDIFVMFDYFICSFPVYSNFRTVNECCGILPECCDKILCCCPRRQINELDDIRDDPQLREHLIINHGQPIPELIMHDNAQPEPVLIMHDNVVQQPLPELNQLGQAQPEPVLIMHDNVVLVHQPLPELNQLEQAQPEPVLIMHDNVVLVHQPLPELNQLEQAQPEPVLIMHDNVVLVHQPLPELNQLEQAQPEPVLIIHDNVVVEPQPPHKPNSPSSSSNSTGTYLIMHDNVVVEPQPPHKPNSPSSSSNSTGTYLIMDTHNKSHPNQHTSTTGLLSETPPLNTNKTEPPKVINPKLINIVVVHPNVPQNNQIGALLEVNQNLSYITSIPSEPNSADYIGDAN